MWEQCAKWMIQQCLIGRDTDTKPIKEKIRIIHDRVIKKLDSQKFVSTDCKSLIKATEFRNQGNLAFSHKNDTEAVRCYTMSVAYASKDSDELAFAYANRSAILLKLGKLKAALVDVNRAVKVKKNPEDKWLKKLQDRKQKIITEIQLKADGNEKNLDEDMLEFDYDARFPFPETNFKNELIPEASEKVKICVNEEMGRHMVAVRDINAGEIIALGRSYAAVIRKEMLRSHCWHCLVRCISLIPCDNCSLVMFCSEKCRETAGNLYHRIECQILPVLFPVFFKSDILALRIFLIATKQGRELKTLQKHPTYGNLFQEKYSDFQEKFNPTDYFTIHNLDDGFRRRNGIEILSDCMKPAFFIRLLKENSIFEQFGDFELPKSNGLTDYELFTGTLFLNCKLLTDINGHSVSELIKPKSKFISHDSIGVGLYPSLCFINHSCESNVLRIQHRNSIILRAVLPINAGEQLFDSYGYGYESAPRSMRQARLLENHFFKCLCEPCKFNWPLLEDIPDTPSPQFLSSKCREKASVIEKHSKVFQRMLLTNLDTKVDNTWNFLVEYLTLLHKNIKKPWKEYFLCQDLVRDGIGQRVTYYFDDEDIL